MTVSYFATAPARTWEWRGVDLVRFNKRGDEPWIKLSHGTIHTDPEDATDPTVTTFVMQMTDSGYAHYLARTLTGWFGDMRVEDAISEALREVYMPHPCYHSHDCCGCRSGSCDVQHITGTLYMVRVSTAANY